ncbi:MAG: alkaline phosphatase PhoX, partial [Acidimicrobiales bacterium]
VLTGGQETYDFAHDFEVDGADQITALSLCLLADDGAVVYINGTEVNRFNMPDGVIDWNTRPIGWIGNADEVYVDYSIGAEALVEGSNVITAEVHNFWPGNPDLSFDLCLETVP